MCEFGALPEYFSPATRLSLCPHHFQLAVLTSSWFFDRKLENCAVRIWREDLKDPNNTTIHPLLVLYAALPHTLLQPNSQFSAAQLQSTEMLPPVNPHDVKGRVWTVHLRWLKSLHEFSSTPYIDNIWGPKGLVSLESDTAKPPWESSSGRGEMEASHRGGPHRSRNSGNKTIVGICCIWVDPCFLRKNKNKKSHAVVKWRNKQQQQTRTCFETKVKSWCHLNQWQNAQWLSWGPG